MAVADSVSGGSVCCRWGRRPGGPVCCRRGRGVAPLPGRAMFPRRPWRNAAVARRRRRGARGASPVAPGGAAAIALAHQKHSNAQAGMQGGRILDHAGECTAPVPEDARSASRVWPPPARLQGPRDAAGPLQGHRRRNRPRRAVFRFPRAGDGRLLLGRRGHGGGNARAPQRRVPVSLLRGYIGAGGAYAVRVGCCLAVVPRIAPAVGLQAFPRARVAHDAGFAEMALCCRGPGSRGPVHRVAAPSPQRSRGAKLFVRGLVAQGSGAPRHLAPGSLFAGVIGPFSFALQAAVVGKCTLRGALPRHRLGRVRAILLSSFSASLRN